MGYTYIYIYIHTHTCDWFILHLLFFSSDYEIGGSATTGGPVGYVIMCDGKQASKWDDSSNFAFRVVYSPPYR